jgi:predicted MFS family arabinose efflux permease
MKLASLAVWSMVTIATGHAVSAFSLLSLRAAMGVSEALYMPAAVALTAAAFSTTARSRALAVLTTAQICGNICGSYFGGWMGDRGQWRSSFFVLGVIGLGYAVPYALFLRKSAEEQPPSERPMRQRFALFELLLIPTFALTCVVFSAFVFGLWLLYSWLPDFLKLKFQLSLGDAAWNATVYLQGATLVGILGGGIAADRLYQSTKASRYWLLAISLVACAPCLYAIGNCETLAATRIAAASFGLASGLFMGNIFPAAYDVVPAATRASAVGILNLFGAEISGFGSYFGGVAKETIGIETLLTITAGIYVIAGAAVIICVVKFFTSDHERLRDDSAPA